ncbi:MAG: GspH/FimT family pseudopilin [Nevskia sp.]|nr:GspH/FimT family pseudopilin [Nevskia sp.]
MPVCGGFSRTWRNCRPAGGGCGYSFLPDSNQPPPGSGQQGLCSRTKRQAGYTLLEVIVAITITAILAAMTVPSFLQSMRVNRGVSEANGILGVVTMARNEAIKRDASISLCPSSNGTGCASSGNWDQGYLAFIDINGNGSFGTGDTLIRTEVPLSGSSTISLCQGVPSTNNTTVSSLTFSGTGQLTSQVYFDVNPTTKSGTACPSSGAAKVTGERYVVVRQIGRANVCDPTDSNCGK